MVGRYACVIHIEAVTFADVRKSPGRACHLAKNAFDDAVLSVDTSNAKFDQNARDSMAILQLLMDDLLLWAEELKGSFLTLNISRVMTRILYRRGVTGCVVSYMPFLRRSFLSRRLR